MLCGGVCWYDFVWWCVVLCGVVLCGHPNRRVFECCHNMPYETFILIEVLACHAAGAIEKEDQVHFILCALCEETTHYRYLLVVKQCEKFLTFLEL